jgi:seryl-tRNA synthetase
VFSLHVWSCYPCVYRTLLHIDMLDINLFFKDKGGDPELVRESQRRRGAPVEAVDEVIALYDEWRRVRFDLDQLNKKMNAVKKSIGQKMKVIRLCSK